VSRLPITVRLTVVFAVVMAAVLAATGLFLYVRLASELDRAIREGLLSRADDVAAFVRRSGPAAGRSDGERLTDADESIAQIVDARGAVVGGTPALVHRSLLAPRELERARDDTILVGRRLVREFDGDPLRLLATPVAAPDGPLVVVVGTSVDDRDEAVRSLATQLLIGGPIALLLATLTAFGVARAALRPVESMRRRAAAISGAEPGRRLPLPPTRDELSRLGETLNAMLARLEAALAHERAFVSDASHELRTPLAILKAELELAMEDGQSQDELKATVRSAAEETERLVRIAEDLLVISRSEQHQLPVRVERHDVGAVLATVRQRFARRADELGCALEVEASRGVTVVADPLRLEQAVGNMVDNALRHGGGRIRLVAQERDRRVELHVLDEGPGFSPEFLGRAFERFSRADEARAGGGTGLGLAVVEGIAVAHGGRAYAANLASGGADVWLSVPVDRDAAARERERHERRQPALLASAPPARSAHGRTAARLHALPAVARARSVLRGTRSGPMRRRAGLLAAMTAIAAASVVTFALVNDPSSNSRSSSLETRRSATPSGAAGADAQVGETPVADAARSAHPPGALTLDPAAETEPVPHAGDAADDPAIWTHPRDPGLSTIIGTDKDGGLAVYDLSGRELQYLADGRLNNVDLRSGFPFGGRRIALVAASDRSDDTIALYRVDERTRRLTAVGSFAADISVYGLCMYRSRRTGEFYVFVDSDRNGGEVEQWWLLAAGAEVRARRVRSFDVGSAAEGCVADDALGHLYIGEEERGIWKYGAEPDAGAGRTLVDSTGPGGHLAADVEGLAIAHGPGGSGLLLASSQGDNTFAVYRREGDNDFVRTFRIGATAGIDPVEDTDGIEVTTTALGPELPEGLFVAQDGSNGAANQNFKLVRWAGLW
jgi:two-component system, OmpR family, sensor kinase